MCIAIRFGSKEINKDSLLWHTIRTSPLYLLSLGSVLQLLLLAVFWLALSSEIIASTALILKPALISVYVILFGVTGFVFLALSMHFYPKSMHSGTIEYLYFGGFFFLANYNLLFFYLANFITPGLIIAAAVFQLVLLLFAFKPVWWSYYWADKKYKPWGHLVNSIFFLLLVSQTVFLFSLF